MFEKRIPARKFASTTVQADADVQMRLEKEDAAVVAGSGAEMQAQLVTTAGLQNGVGLPHA